MTQLTTVRNPATSVYYHLELRFTERGLDPLRDGDAVDLATAASNLWLWAQTEFPEARIDRFDVLSITSTPVFGTVRVEVRRERALEAELAASLLQ